MKTALYGRLLFGASTVLFGVVLFLWHDADAWEGMLIPKLPAGDAIADIVAIASIVGGVLLMVPRTVHLGSIVSGIIFVIFSLANLPPIIAHPTSFASYVNFPEFFALVCGALALYGMTGPDTARAPVYARVARLLLGLCTISFLAAQVYYPKDTASLVPVWIPPTQMFWVIVTDVAFGLAAIAMLINVQARLATYLMALMIGLFGVLVWVPIVVAGPQKHFSWAELALNFLIAGATWMVADAQTPVSRGART